MAGRRSFGSVRKLASGRWQALYTDTDTGKRVTGPVTFVTKADATRWLATTEADLHRGDHLDLTARSVAFGTYATT